MGITAVPSFADISMMAAYLRVDIRGDDAFAQLCLDGATRAIQDYCGQTLGIVASDTVILDGSGSEIMLLPEFPVSAVEEVITDIDTDTPRILLDRTNGSNAEYDFVEDAGLLVRRRGQFILYEDRFSAVFGAWPGRRSSVQVTYTHGYDPVPPAVQIICVTVAARAWAQDGATQEMTGTYTAMYAGQPGELTEAERWRLDRYRARRQ